MRKVFAKENLAIIAIFAILALLVHREFVAEDVRIVNQPVSIPAPETPPEKPKPVSPHQSHITKLETEAGIPLSPLATLLTRDEGVRAYPYADSEGFITIGVGRSLQTKGITITELHAIIPTPEYKHLITHAQIRNGRIYIDNIDVAKRVFSKPLTKDDIHLLLVDDIKDATADAESVFGSTWQEIDEVRKMAIVDTVYNLGLTHFKTFKHFIEHVKAKDWNKAANELLLSEAAHQNIARYHRNALVVQKGDRRYFHLTKLE